MSSLSNQITNKYVQCTRMRFLVEDLFNFFSFFSLFIYYFFLLLYFHTPPQPLSSVQVESYVETKPIQCIESSFYETISFTLLLNIIFSFHSSLMCQCLSALAADTILFYMSFTIFPTSSAIMQKYIKKKK